MTHEIANKKIFDNSFFSIENSIFRSFLAKNLKIKMGIINKKIDCQFIIIIAKMETVNIKPQISSQNKIPYFS